MNKTAVTLQMLELIGEEMSRLDSVNAELLEALQMLLANPNSGLWANNARSVIAKAQA